jgi:hypothetical protein
MKKLLLLLSSLFLISCSNGYRKQNGQWVWVTYDSAFKKRVTFIEYTDKKSFKVLPMDLSREEAREFKVTNTGELMRGMKTTMLLSVFISQNPEYAWVDTLGISHVI